MRAASSSTATGCRPLAVHRAHTPSLRVAQAGLKRCLIARGQARSPFDTGGSAAPAPAAALGAASSSSSSSQGSSWRDGVTFHKWQYNGHTVNYVTAGCGPPVLLVHGFGASVGHYRKLIPALAQTHKVYALDLLGFGASEKPLLPQYTIETWADQINAFCAEFVDRPCVLVGNSIGSLACLTAAAEAPEGRWRALALLNSAGAMNNKGVLGDWRIVLVYPLFLLIDALLKTPLAGWLFAKYSTPDNVRNILQQVYMDPGAVDDELVDILVGPSKDDNALHVFVSVITGPPGPKPWDLVPRISAPMLVAWGDRDPFTPLDGPVGKYFRAVADTRPGTAFALLNDVGHCPQDDRPERLLAFMLPWLRGLPAAAAPASAAAAAAAE